MKTHMDRLQLLKQKSFNPQVIYDIGAFRGEWSTHISNVFPESNFFLFQANKNNEPYLKKQRFPYFIELLGNKNNKTIFYSNEKSPLIYETLNLMHSLGYQIIDILEHHYLPSLELNEIDVLFIKTNSKLIKTGIMF